MCLGDYTDSSPPSVNKWENYSGIYRIILVIVVGSLLLLIYGRVIYELQKRKKQSQLLKQKLQFNAADDETDLLEFDIIC